MERGSAELTSWLERVEKLHVSWLESGEVTLEGEYMRCEKEIVYYSVSFVLELNQLLVGPVVIDTGLGMEDHSWIPTTAIGRD